ncbi:unnamed protein product [Ilex paraguariensis]|uniref:SNF1-related protein kinase regulatory subunit gamma-like PV42a n=1 Tax=Ilex paraguariensis TaxID=185542 RepID=A0ABC8UX24_9AQUA
MQPPAMEAMEPKRIRTQSSSETQSVRDKKVRDMIADKKRLVEVPYTASLAHTMNALVANRVLAVPVAAPPGHWIGAGGSMILESDKQTGAVRKHYIGMVTMLDLLVHIAGDDADGGGGGDGYDLDRRMSVPVSSIIGHCLESLSLWTLNPNTRQSYHAITFLKHTVTKTSLKNRCYAPLLDLSDGFEPGRRLSDQKKIFFYFFGLLMRTRLGIIIFDGDERDYNAN